MSHESFLTTRDKIGTSVQPSSGGLFVSWGAATVGFAIAAVLTGGLATGAGIILAAAAALTGLKTVAGLFENKKTWKKPNVIDPLSDSTHHRHALSPNLANNLAPIPEVDDDVSNLKWRQQVAEQARRDIKRDSRNSGY